MKKGLLSFLIIFVAIVTGFFFWGSSSNISTSQFSGVYEYGLRNQNPSIDTFTMVTYNIGYLSGMTNNKAVDRSQKLYDDNLNQAIGLFKNLNPDFIAFQEIDFDADRSFNINQMNKLAEQLSFEYSAKAVNWDKRYVPFPYWPISQQFGKVVSGQAILSQFNFESNEIVTLVKPEGNPFYYNAFYLDRLAQVSKIKVNNKELIIINVHLEAFHPNTREIQIKTVLNLFDNYAKNHPVILCGDFNSTPPGATNPWQTDQVIQTMLNHTGIVMAIDLDANNADESGFYTFNSENPDRRIDYFFYNPDRVFVVEGRTVTEAKQISDHLPVWMKFVLK